MSKKYTTLDYCQYLLSSQINYTITNLADHVEGDIAMTRSTEIAMAERKINNRFR